MGIFDKLKSAASFVIGNGAEVTIELPESVIMGETFDVRIKALSKKDIEGKRVYLIVESVEKVESSVRVRSYDDDEDEYSTRTRHINDTYELYSNEIDVSESFKMQEGETLNWNTKVNIPRGNQPTYKGHNCSHIWKIKVGLDIRGTDPSSSWYEIEVFNIKD